MNKFGKLLFVGGIAAAMVLSAGCGDDKKPAPASSGQKSVAQKSSAAQKPAAPAAPAVKAPENGNWRYPSYIKTEADTPKMTPEIQKIVDECFAQMTLHPSEKGKLLNDSRIGSTDQRKVVDMWFHAKGENHDTKNKFKNSKGKEVYTQEVYHINISVDRATSAVKKWKFTKFIVTPDAPDGQTVVIKEVK